MAQTTHISISNSVLELAFFFPGSILSLGEGGFGDVRDEGVWEFRGWEGGGDGDEEMEMRRRNR